MTPDKIQKIFGSINKVAHNLCKISIPSLLVKLESSLKLYPDDKTIGSVYRIIEKKAETELFISRADLINLYNKLYSYNSIFSDVFADELGIVKQAEVQQPKLESDVPVAPYKTDSILLNALNHAFDNSIPLKSYSEELASKAIYTVNNDLDSWQLKPTSLTVSEGNQNFLILRADYETPKGITSIYIPVETYDNKISKASLFIANTGPKDLDYNNIKSYILSNSGNKLKISASNVLDILVKTANSNDKISNAEYALAQLNLKRSAKEEYFANQILGQEVDKPAKPDVQPARLEQERYFSDKMASSNGMAAFKFGQKNISTAKDLIDRELKSFGYKEYQLSLSDYNDNTVFYSVALDGRVAFTVPVKVDNGIVNKPNIFLCNGSVHSLNKSEIDKLYINNDFDYKVAASASPSFKLSSGDLINNIRSAVREGNTSKAEDALNILANRGDTQSYAIGFKVYLDGLSNKPEEISKCAMIISNNTSKYQICGHTGLPLHKVYQDKEGHCRPLYRRTMDESYEAVTFMNHKIFG